MLVLLKLLREALKMRGSDAVLSVALNSTVRAPCSRFPSKVFIIIEELTRFIGGSFESEDCLNELASSVIQGVGAVGGCGSSVLAEAGTKLCTWIWYEGTLTTLTILRDFCPQGEESAQPIFL